MHTQHQNLQREVNCLSDENRRTRKCALEKIKLVLTQHKESSPYILHGLLDFLLKPLLRCFSDPVEKCREVTIDLVAE